MSQSGTPLAVELKTVSGRKCTVDPPFTVQRLVDAAVDQLHLKRSTIKLFVGRQLVYMWKPEDSEPNQRLRAQVTVPKGGSVLVAGKPVLREKTHPARAKGVDAPKGSPAADEAAEKKKPLLTPVASAADDGMYIRCGSSDRGLYRFLKPLVFMLGRRGLHHLFLVAKGQYGHLPESFQDHPVMVCIVEYVDRDPGRLKEILNTIQEEEPGLMRWIETHAEFFLNVINTPPQWRDDTSPIWLIRHAKKVYSAENTKKTDKSELVRAVTPSYKQMELIPEDIADNEILLNEIGLPQDADSGEVNSNPDSSRTASLESIQSTAVMESSTKDLCPEEDSLFDITIQELQTVYRAWELAKERHGRAVGKLTDKKRLESELKSRVRDVHSTLMRAMESYILTPPSPASLKKLLLIGQHAWSESEQWFIEKGHVFNALDTALGRLLFNAGKELLMVRNSTHNQKKSNSSNSTSSPISEFQQFPALDLTIRWITANGPSILAHQLREYSLQQSVSIVMYSQTSCNQVYAYVVRDGDVKIAPIVVDEHADRELKELERLYEVMSQTYAPKDAMKMRRVIRSRWAGLLGKLYQRLLSPIEGFLPSPALKPHVPPSEVGQICIIDTWAPDHIPIPFPALWNPADGASCLLQWAVFKANRPWDLISSAEVPWSNPVANSPVITRVAAPIVVRPTMSVVEEPTCSRTNMVTYVNTSDIGCVSVGDKTRSRPLKGANKVEYGELWQNVPWEHWIQKALGTFHAGIPTYAFLKGKDSMQNGATALFIHEVVFAENESITSTRSSSPPDGKGKKVLTAREMPYNQSADLFVSHVVGRDSGVGIHRAALLPTFKVTGRDPAETYASFLKTLVATNDMTAAKAYRLAVLISWHTDCREEPWRSASLMLFNYGGTMNTLSFIYSEYCKKRYLKSLHIFRGGDANSNKDAEKQQNEAQLLRNQPSICNTADGCYVRKHGIDAIYEVVLHGLSIARPQGEVAILDNMIQCIENNRSTLEECVKRRREGKDVVQALDTSPAELVFAPSLNSDGGVSFVSPVREIVTAFRKGGEETGSSGLPTRDMRPRKGNQPPNSRRPPSDS
ncbi:putative XPC-binding domain containing protein [Trypanosoma cruzi]|nr:putative XPC-binding domain containing protein [Trypanosoma cruzi]